MAGRRLSIARGTEAADEQDVGVFIVGVQPHELGCALDRRYGLASPEQRERRLMENRARHPRDVPTLALEPQLEAGARPEGQTVEELVAEAGEGNGLHPGASFDDVDVDECPGPQREGERIPAELAVAAEPASQRRERPTESSQRVVRLGKEKAGQMLAGGRHACAQEVGEEAPRLVAARSVDRISFPLDPRRAEKQDAQAHLRPKVVTRVVTRLTVTLPLVKFNASQGRERTCG